MFKGSGESDWECKQILCGNDDPYGLGAKKEARERKSIFARKG